MSIGLRGGTDGAAATAGSSESWLICCPLWLQARHHHCVPSGSGTKLFYLYRYVFIIHLEVCESIITMSLWLSQPCNNKIYIADLCMPTRLIYNWYSLTNWGKSARNIAFYIHLHTEMQLILTFVDNRNQIFWYLNMWIWIFCFVQFQCSTSKWDILCPGLLLQEGLEQIRLFNLLPLKTD